MTELLPFEKISSITFKNRPVSLPTEYRAMYKVVQLILFISACGRGNKMTLLQLHFLNWLFHNPDQFDIALNSVKSQQAVDLPFAQLDPMVNYALEYSIGSALITISTSGSLCLTTKALNLLDKLAEDDEIMQSEKAFIMKVTKSFTDKVIRQILR